MLQAVAGSLSYRTIWLSDIHLGDRHCKADYLLEFLGAIRCETLFLVGDIVDLWSLSNRWHWPAQHSEVLRRVLELADGGTRVVFVPGNHDELIRDFVGNAFGKIAIERQALHVSATGKRLLITHGDEFESWIRCSAFTRFLGSASYGALLRLNRAYNRWRSWRGKPYWSLATYVKHRVANARRAIDSFEHAASAHARVRGFDGIVCCNDGDWVENCTALAETAAGALELLHWPRLRAHGPGLRAANDHEAATAAAAAAAAAATR
jgi:UDP-2,3-diacylglucosamine pyrophosphatase LpxH